VRDVKMAHRRNVVGEFADDHSARSAVRFLEHAGIPADDVSVISDDVRRAREVSGSRSPQGAVIGAIVGLVVLATFVVTGGPVMWSNPVALVLGAAGFVGAGVAIGALAGRGRIFVAERGERYENAIEAGETLVSVHVSDAERERARRLLREAGAVRLREEGTVEAA
jgi:hypothetical protein